MMKIFNLRRLLVAVFIVVVPMYAYPASYAVNPACDNNGTGESWACAASPGGVGAFNTLPPSASIARGDTIWLADGVKDLASSTGYVMDKAVSGTSVITIKKATASAHGPTTGWDNSYGDGQIELKNSSDSRNTVFSARSSYYTIDGVTNGGSNPDNYGIKISAASSSPTQGESTLMFTEGNTYSVTNYTIANVAFINLGGSVDIQQINFDGGFSSTLLQYNYFGDAQNFIHGTSANITIENNYFKDNWTSSGHHGEAMSVCPTSGFIVRNNIFDNAVNGTGGIGCQTPAGFTLQGWQFYNNVVIGGNAGNGFLCNDSRADKHLVDARIYNNTFINTNARVYTLGTSSSGNQVYNNLYYASGNGSTACASCTYDHNYYTVMGANTRPASETNAVEGGSEEPFTDRAGGDYTLAAGSMPIDNGVDLSAYFTTDYLGNTRSGTWDIGAYEYIGVPTLLTPAADSFAGWPVSFTWEPYTGAVMYNLQVDDNSDFSSPEIDIETTDTEVDVYPEDNLLQYSTHYYWHVRVKR